MTYDPADVFKFCETIADAICPAWRRPGTVVMDSIPRFHDPQTGLVKKSTASPENFNYWAFERQPGVGLIQHCIIDWSLNAVRSYVDAAKRNWAPLSGALPVFIEVQMNAANVGVAGDQNRRGSTAYLLDVEIIRCMANMSAMGLFPRHPGISDVSFRTLIHVRK